MLEYATLNDIRKLFQMYMDETAIKYLSFRKMSFNVFRTMLQKEIEEKHYFVYKDEEKKIVAACHLEPLSSLPMHYLLSSVVVLNEERRKGYAFAMLQELFDILETKNTAYIIYLGVDSDNCRAIALYRKLGFRIIGNHPKISLRTYLFKHEYCDGIAMCLNTGVESQPVQSNFLSSDFHFEESKVLIRKAKNSDCNIITNFCFDQTLLPNSIASDKTLFLKKMKQMLSADTVYVCEDKLKHLLAVAIVHSLTSSYRRESHRALFFIGFHSKIRAEIATFFVCSIISNIEMVTNIQRLEAQVIDGDTRVKILLLQAGMVEECTYPCGIKAMSSSHYSDVHVISSVRLNLKRYPSRQQVVVSTGMSCSVLAVVGVSLMKVGIISSTIPFVGLLSLALIITGGSLLLGGACYYTYQKWFFAKSGDFSDASNECSQALNHHKHCTN